MMQNGFNGLYHNWSAGPRKDGMRWLELQLTRDRLEDPSTLDLYNQILLFKNNPFEDETSVSQPAQVTAEDSPILSPLVRSRI
jgi:hypothetical protein